MIKEVFIFGAGASHASGGTPLGKDLVWNYFEDCSTLYEIGSNGKPASHDIEEKKREFINFGIFLKSIKDIFPSISEYERWQQCMNEGEMHIPRIDKKYYIDEIMEALLRRGDRQNINLIKRLTLEHIAGTSYASQNLLYKKFVATLLGKAYSQISIISFNLDCLLHEDFKNKVYFDYLLDFKYIDGNRLSYEKGRGFPLIKLHGSLDWAYNFNTKEISLLFPHITTDTYKFDFNKDGGSEVEPYIFLPHEEKDKQIELLWERAREEIKQARKITVIGYSFPSYDKDVIKMFQENTNTDSEIVIIDTVDYASKSGERKEELMKKYKTLFPNLKNITIKLDGFQDYVSQS